MTVGNISTNPVSHPARWHDNGWSDKFGWLETAKPIKAEQSHEDEETTSTWEKQKSPTWRDDEAAQKDEDPARTKEWENQKQPGDN